jgi:hypothetical protein
LLNCFLLLTGRVCASNHLFFFHACLLLRFGLASAARRRRCGF